MNYIFFASIAAVCFAISIILNKLLSKHAIANPDSLMVYFMLTTFSFALFLTPFVSLTIPTFSVFKLIVLAVIPFLIGYYCFYHGIFKADASSFAPLFQIQTVVVGLLAFLFLGERFPIANYIWMVGIVLGTIFVSFDETMSPKSFLQKGIGLIVLMQIFHSVANIFVGFALKQIPPVEFLFWEDMFIGFASLLFIFLKKPKMNYGIRSVIPMFVTSVVVGIGVLALFQAFKENLTLSSVLGMMSTPIVFMVSLVASTFSPKFLEHHSGKVYLVRGIGLAIILVAAYKISVG